MHKIVEIICECGAKRNARRSRVMRGEITHCGSCAFRIAMAKRRISQEQKRHTEAFHTYKCNAKRKGINFLLDRKQVDGLLSANCFYCGTATAFGIDRRDNALGYTSSNSVPCCSQCNYAKRDQKEADFVAWICRVYGRLFS